MDGEAWWAAVHGVAKSWTRLSNFTFTFHCHALEKAMATHSSVLAWRIPGMGGAWWAAVYGVAQSRTRLKRLSSSSICLFMVLEKAEEPEIKLPTSAGSSKKQESSRKTYKSIHVQHTPHQQKKKKKHIIISINAEKVFDKIQHPFRRRQWQPTPVLLPGKSHGWRGLVGCSPWGR